MGNLCGDTAHIKRKILIAGTPRSATTVFTRMLGKALETSALHEGLLCENTDSTNTTHLQEKIS